MNRIRKVHIASAVVMTLLASFAAVAEDSAKAATDAEKKEESSSEKADGTKYLPLAEARAKIGDVISDPAQMTELMKQLSPEDQKSFVADVNAAIAKLPGSNEDKTAKYLNVNRAAIKGAAKGNMANVLAVTFATVPPESLTVISERYAVDLFNRDADPSHKYSDAAYEKIAKEVVGKVTRETSGSDDAGVRNTLAILMFLKATNGPKEELTESLIAILPDSTSRQLAKEEWIPAAMAEGEEKSYEAMLAYADAGRPPDITMVMSLAGPQILEAALVDMTSGMNDAFGIQTTPVLDQAFGGFEEAVNYIHKDTTGTGTFGAVPRSRKDVPWNPDYKRDDPLPKPQPEPPEPKPYPYGTL